MDAVGRGSSCSLGHLWKNNRITTRSEALAVPQSHACMRLGGVVRLGLALKVVQGRIAERDIARYHSTGIWRWDFKAATISSRRSLCEFGVALQTGVRSPTGPWVSQKTVHTCDGDA